MTLSGFIAAGIVGAAGVGFRKLTDWFGDKFFANPPETTAPQPERRKAKAATR